MNSTLAILIDDKAEIFFNVVGGEEPFEFLYFATLGEDKNGRWSLGVPSAMGTMRIQPLHKDEEPAKSN